MANWYVVLLESFQFEEETSLSLVIKSNVFLINCLILLTRTCNPLLFIRHDNVDEMGRGPNSLMMGQVHPCWVKPKAYGTTLLFSPPFLFVVGSFQMTTASEQSQCTDLFTKGDSIMIQNSLAKKWFKTCSYTI